jgi:predicted nucleic acid-binding protein
MTETSQSEKVPNHRQGIFEAIVTLTDIFCKTHFDEGLASQAAGLGARHKVRGADAVFLGTAALFAAELATLDREQLERGASIVQTLTPTGFLSTIKHRTLWDKMVPWEGLTL